MRELRTARRPPSRGIAKKAQIYLLRKAEEPSPSSSCNFTHVYILLPTRQKIEPHHFHPWSKFQHHGDTRVFAENLVGLGFLQSVSYIKPIPTHEKIFAVGKSAPTATFNLIFLGLGWAWIGEFVGFIIIFISFPTQHNLVNRKHPTL